MSQPEPRTEPDYPFPPRYWWLKRISRWSVLLVLTFAVAIFWWRYEGRRRFNAEVTRIHGMGEPIFLTDLPSAHVRDDENAIVTIQNAIRAIALNPAQTTFVQGFLPVSPPDATGLATLATINAASTKVLQLVRLARFQPQAQQTGLNPPWIAGFSRSSDGYRDLATLLCAIATYQHAIGNEAAAVEIERDMLRQAKAIDQDNSPVLTHLFAIAVAGIACDAIGNASSDLKISPDSGATTQPTGPASREQVRALIAELLDEQVFQEALVGTFRNERLTAYDAATNFGKYFMRPWAVPQVVMTPILDMSMAAELKQSDATIAAAEKSNFPQSRAALPDIGYWEKPRTGPTSLAQFPRNRSHFTHERFFASHYQAAATRRVTALRLAIRLYQLDHNQELPQQLDDLVPAYLPSIPIDPFSPEGHTFVYRLTPQPRIYSVGRNGVDDNGSATLIRVSSYTSPPYGFYDYYQVWDGPDAVFPLK